MGTWTLVLEPRDSSKHQYRPPGLLVTPFTADAYTGVVDDLLSDVANQAGLAKDEEVTLLMENRAGAVVFFPVAQLPMALSLIAADQQLAKTFFPEAATDEGDILLWYGVRPKPKGKVRRGGAALPGQGLLHSNCLK